MDVRAQARTLIALALLLPPALARPQPGAALGWSPRQSMAQLYDPLTRSEADQVRHTSGQLNKRPPLLLHFARERLDRFQRLRTASPPPPARNTQLYSLLRQYHAILREADDAVDELFDACAQCKNTPKVLRQVVAAEQAMQAELQRIRSASTPADLARYHFELDDCLDLTRDCLQNAGGYLAKLGGKP